MSHKLQRFQDVYFGLAKQLKRQTQNPDPGNLLLMRSQQVGRKLFEAMLMKIVYIDLRKGELQLFQVKEQIFNEITNSTKNIDLIPEIVHRVFFQMYLTQVYGTGQFQVIEKEFGELANRIIENRSLNQSTQSIKKYQIEFGRPQTQQTQLIQSPIPQNFQPDRVQLYLSSEVQHPKTQLTEFCHQMKIPQPTYSKTSEGKIFNVTCSITIPAEIRDEFNKTEFLEQASNLNGKLATVEAARKLLKRMYNQNNAIFEKFKDIKRRRKIIT